MSAFTDFLAAGFDESGEIFGMTEVTIDGHPFFALLDQYSASKEVVVGGMMGLYDGTCMIKASLLAEHFSAPLEKTLAKKKLTAGTRVFRIDRASEDELTLTLALVNPNQGP